MIKISSNSSLAEFQAHNDEVYRETNDRLYSLERLFAKVHRHVTHASKPIRKHYLEKRELEFGKVMYHLCMALDWSFAMFNRYHIDLSEDMWKRFPGLCPYCQEAPCCCKKRPKNRQKLLGSSKGEKPVSLRQWQEMFAIIYPNEALVSTLHLNEEAGEVNEALQAHSVTLQMDLFWKVIEELVDLVTNIFGVANCLKMDLAEGMAFYFADGCPKCKHPICECGFVLFDEPIPFIPAKAAE